MQLQADSSEGDSEQAGRFEQEPEVPGKSEPELEQVFCFNSPGAHPSMGQSM